MICAACCSIIAQDEEYLRCSIGDCCKTYHLDCAGGRTLIEPLNAWICPECRCATKKGGDNSSTPVGSTKKSFDYDYVTHRKKPVPPCSINDSSVVVEHSEILTEEVKILRQEIQSLKDQLSHAIGLIIGCESTVINYATEVKQLNQRLEEVVTVVGAVAASQEQTLQHLSSASVLVAAAENRVVVPCQTDITAITAAVSGSHTDAYSQIIEVVEAVTTLPAVPSADKSCREQIVATMPAAMNAVPKKRKHKNTANNCNLVFTRPTPSPSYSQDVGEKNESVVMVLEDTEVSAPATHPDVEQWTEVKKKREQRPASLCGTAGPAKTTLKAVEPRKYIHLWNMASNIDDIRAYLRQLCPSGTCSVQELTPRGDYKSFKIGVPVAAYNICFTTDAWPVNSRIKAWIPFQRSAGNAYTDKSDNGQNAPSVNKTSRFNQSFRGQTKL